MKVIICFGPVRVVVPCGDGEISIREVMDRAVHRYLKTLDNSSSVCVNILNLKTFDNYALLDPGDRLKDVVDDKEQLVATFSLSAETFREHRNGDGMSGSSGGSPSPEFVRICKKDEEESFEAVITSQDFNSRDDNLIVRRCSDEVLDFPALVPASQTRFQHEKSSSVPVHMPGDISSRGSSRRKANNGSNQTLNSGHHNFVHNELKNEFTPKRQTSDGRRTDSRDVSGKNFNTRIIPLKSPDPILASSYFQQNVNELSNRRHNLRTESTGTFGHHHLHQSNSSSDLNDCNESQHLREKVVSSKDMLGISTSTLTSRKDRFVVELKKGVRGLGFSVTTQDNKTNEEESFIFVKKILPSGSAIEDGRLQPGDCILEVNGVPMTGKPQEEVVAFLRKIPVNENVVLLVARAAKSLYLPSLNLSENLISHNKTEGRTDFNRNYSEGASLSDLGRRRTKSDSRQIDHQHDADSILSSESDSRSQKPRFTREGRGRQSMSEKRKGHLDPRSTETFEKIQNHRSERKNFQQCRADSVESLMDKCNTSELNWSSSCEGVFGSFRTRAINDSFRAAIDKCFDAGDFTSLPEASIHDRENVALDNEDQQRHDKQKIFLKSFGKTKKPTENYKKAEKSSKVINQPMKSENKGSHYSPISWK